MGGGQLFLLALEWQSLSMKFSIWLDALEKALSVLATTLKMLAFEAYLRNTSLFDPWATEKMLYV